MRIEILYFDGCPNWHGTLATVERVVAELGVEAEVEALRVPNLEAAERLRFLGSPTVRVNGGDIEPGADARSEVIFACRVYWSDGEFSGEPDERWLRDALVEGDTGRGAATAI